MDRAKTIEEAEKILDRIRPPSKGCDLKTYRSHVIGFVANKATVAHLATLAAYYQCSADDLVEAITRDKFGKG